MCVILKLWESSRSNWMPCPPGRGLQIATGLALQPMDTEWPWAQWTFAAFAHAQSLLRGFVTRGSCRLPRNKQIQPNSPFHCTSTSQLHQWKDSKFPLISLPVSFRSLANFPWQWGFLLSSYIWLVRTGFLDICLSDTTSSSLSFLLPSAPNWPARLPPLCLMLSTLLTLCWRNSTHWSEEYQ